MATFEKECTLHDVSAAIASRRAMYFNRLKAYIVNYTAETDFPFKFVYNGCTYPRGHFHCARANCEHGSKWKQPLYRFKLQLTDRSPEPPFTVSIFGMGRILMGITALELSQRPFDAQLAMVRAKTSIGTPCEFYIKVKEDLHTGEFVAVIDNMYPVDNNEDEVLNELLGAPSSASRLIRSPTDLQTSGLPHSTSGSSSGNGGSTQRQGRGSRNNSKGSNVKSKLTEFVDIIDLTTRKKLADYLDAIELSDD